MLRRGIILSEIKQALEHGAFKAMSAYCQFICFKIVPGAREGKFDKLPCDYRTGAVADAHNPMIWTDAHSAVSAAERLGNNYGVSFVLTAADPFFCIDIDGCLLPDGSDWSPLAKSIVACFPNAGVEVSRSGKGLHIFGTGTPPANHRNKNVPLGIELYTQERHIALTGTHATGDAATNCTPSLEALVTQFFKPTEDEAGAAVEWSTGPCAEWNGNTDDAQLLSRMMRSAPPASVFSGKAVFADLYERNVTVLSKSYPDSERPYDESSADRALAQMLMFWTGRDCERTLRLMLASKLTRPKWERDDYLKRTILSAMRDSRDVLTDKIAEALLTPEAYTEADGHGAATSRLVVGDTFCTIDAQVQMFVDCVYVQSREKILIKGGVLLKPSQFKVKYGGNKFVMDAENAKVSTDAFEAFTQSHLIRHPQADSTCFKPDLPPATIVRDAGRTRVNTWWPVTVPRKVGDATPFITHLKKLIPDARDREIFMCYMAAVVQHKGVKFQWAPLIQGVEGNGKTLFTQCVAEAVGRRYTHMPPAHEISEKFNSWLFDTIFIGVEDIYVPDQKVEVFEIIKPMITATTLARRAMNTEQEMCDVVCNFIFNSNHKDGLRKYENDRRICNIFTAQQKASDIARDGMDGHYFQKLYSWLRADGHAIVNELLHTYPIADEFNPATSCQRAPRTTSTAEAIEMGMGTIEQEVKEAIEQGLVGFRGDWVSSVQLANFLDTISSSRRLPRSKRKGMLESLGYEQHPALQKGRVSVTVLPDGNMPTLYVKRGSPSYSLTTQKAIVDAYQDAQLIMTQ